MENGKIKAFKVNGNKAIVKYTQNVEEQGKNTVKDHGITVHRSPSDSLMIQMRTLLGHALLIGGLATDKEITEKDMSNRKVVDMPKFKNFNITGFELNKDGESEEISFTVLVSPVIGSTYSFTLKPFGLHNESYPYSHLLVDDKENLISEVESYIEGKNYYVQTNMFENKPEATEAEEF